MKSRRRYEILLPLQFNDGRPVPESLIWETIEQLEQRFGAVSWETQVIRGVWLTEGVVFRDNNTRLCLDVEDTPGQREFFVGLKERLKSKFQQLDIWITSHVVDVI